MFEAKEDILLAPGTWKLWKAGPPPRVFLSCPGCKRIGLLEHEISDGGVVTPSVDCPNDDCAFHENVTLVGWVPPPKV